MEVEILWSGLCALQLLTGAGADVKCSNMGHHQVRVTVEARQVQSGPRTSQPAIEWTIGPDGTEYASFDVTKLSKVEFQNANGVAVKRAAFQANVGELLTSKLLGLSERTSPNWKFDYRIDHGTIEAVGKIQDPTTGKDLCFTHPETAADLFPRENVVWRHAGPNVLLVIDGESLVLQPVGGPVRVSISNDVTHVREANPSTVSAFGEFAHWMMVPELNTGNFRRLKQCGAPLTSRPICNLIRIE